MIRADMIKDISSNLGDLVEGTLTAATSATSVADSARMESDGHWTGGELALNGEAREVVDWVGPTFTTNAFSATPSVGDPYELRKLEGHRRDLLIRYLNMGIRDFSKVAWERMDSIDDLGDTTTYDADGDSNQYAVPLGMDWVHSILWQKPAAFSDSTWYELTAREWVPSAPGYVRLFPETEPTDGSLLKFLGSRKPRELTTDGQQCYIDSLFPVLYATARMCLVLAKGNGAQEWKDQFSVYYKDAQETRERDRKSLPSGSRKVR